MIPHLISDLSLFVETISPFRDVFFGEPWLNALLGLNHFNNLRLDSSEIHLKRVLEFAEANSSNRSLKKEKKSKAQFWSSPTHILPHPLSNDFKQQAVFLNDNFWARDPKGRSLIVRSYISNLSLLGRHFEALDSFNQHKMVFFSELSTLLKTNSTPQTPKLQCTAKLTPKTPLLLSSLRLIVSLFLQNQGSGTHEGLSHILDTQVRAIPNTDNRFPFMNLLIDVKAFQAILSARAESFKQALSLCDFILAELDTADMQSQVAFLAQPTSLMVILLYSIYLDKENIAKVNQIKEPLTKFLSLYLHWMLQFQNDNAGFHISVQTTTIILQISHVANLQIALPEEICQLLQAELAQSDSLSEHLKHNSLHHLCPTLPPSQQSHPNSPRFVKHRCLRSRYLYFQILHFLSNPTLGQIPNRIISLLVQDPIITQSSRNPMDWLLLSRYFQSIHILEQPPSKWRLLLDCLKRFFLSAGLLIEEFQTKNLVQKASHNITRKSVFVDSVRQAFLIVRKFRNHLLEYLSYQPISEVGF